MWCSFLWAYLYSLQRAGLNSLRNPIRQIVISYIPTELMQMGFAWKCAQYMLLIKITKKTHSLPQITIDNFEVSVPSHRFGRK